jgi:hypothetical protein
MICYPGEILMKQKRKWFHTFSQEKGGKKVKAMMRDKDILIKEVSELPDFMVDQLLAIVRYVKLGIENEYLPETDNEFYNSEQFKRIVSKSVAEYHRGKAEDMDILAS